MKYEEQQIVELAKKVLKDIDDKYYRENCIEKVFFIEKELILKGIKKGKTSPCWGVAIKSLFDNTDFLTISDETGEPLYYQNFNCIIREIGKDDDGRYYRIRD